MPSLPPMRTESGPHRDFKQDFFNTIGPVWTAATTVMVEAVERLHWRLWNGKAKDAQIGIDRIRRVLHHFQGEQGERTSIVPSRKLWTAL